MKIINVDDSRKITIPTKKEIITETLIISFATTLILAILIHWIIGITVSIFIGYFYLREFYPSISIARAEKIFRQSRMCQIGGDRIPCSAHLLKLMNRRNSKLHFQYRTYRWFLASDPNFLKNHPQTTAIGIPGQDYFFLIQECYSEAYMEQKRRAKKLESEKELLKQKTANR